MLRRIFMERTKDLNRIKVMLAEALNVDYTELVRLKRYSNN